MEFESERRDGSKARATSVPANLEGFLWHCGAVRLTGVEIELEPIPEGAKPVNGLEVPLVVRPGGGSPDQALQE